MCIPLYFLQYCLNASPIIIHPFSYDTRWFFAKYMVCEYLWPWLGTNTRVMRWYLCDLISRGCNVTLFVCNFDHHTRVKYLRWYWFSSDLILLMYDTFRVLYKVIVRWKDYYLSCGFQLFKNSCCFFWEAWLSNMSNTTLELVAQPHIFKKLYSLCSWCKRSLFWQLSPAFPGKFKFIYHILFLQMF